MVRMSIKSNSFVFDLNYFQQIININISLWWISFWMFLLYLIKSFIKMRIIYDIFKSLELNYRCFVLYLFLFDSTCSSFFLLAATILIFDTLYHFSFYIFYNFLCCCFLLTFMKFSFMSSKIMMAIVPFTILMRTNRNKIKTLKTQRAFLMSFQCVWTHFQMTFLALHI